MAEHNEIVIVGAGMAGLRAAQLLRQQNIKVTVFEARDRVGGRIYTTQVGGTAFDLGGQWVGPQQKRLIALAKELGVANYPQHHRGYKLLSWQGKLRRFRGEVPMLSPLAMFELWRTERFMKKAAHRIPPEAPWACPNADRWDSQTLEQWKQQRFWSKGAKLFLDIVSRAICTAEPSELSLLYFLSYLRWGDGLNTLISIPNGAQKDRFVGGVQPLCQKLADPLGANLHLGEPILGIRQHDDHVVLKTDRGEYTAQRVIVAIPPILAGEIMYDSPLPSQRAELTRNMPMGSVIKYVAIYDRSFWREAGFSGEAFADTGPCVTTFDACTSTGTSALVTFSDGAMAREHAQKTPEERREAVLEQFITFFGPQAAKPLAFAEKNWLAETWSRGCYAGIMSPGVMTKYGPALAKPCGRIHWAGTETATQWMGYIEGALQSAERVTQEVLPLLKRTTG